MALLLEVSMTKNVSFAVAVLAAVCLTAAAPSPRPARLVNKGSFLPTNSMKIQVGALSAGGITHAQFDAVMDQIAAIYGPIIAKRGKRLVINRLWDDPTVNASAQEMGDQFILNMYGGLARHPAITQDGMALVACHEMGHHLGGAPKYGGTDWASNEGESDYFATTKCLHRVFADPGATAFTRPSGDEGVAASACAKAYKGAKDRAVCTRSAMAGLSVTTLFTDLGGDPAAHFDTPDASVVSQTDDSHPASQCRLDTYFQGALCTKPYTTDMDDNDPNVGGCGRADGYTVGVRPLCWYKPAAGLTSVASVPAPRAIKTPAIVTARQSQGAALWQGL
jgi:hypothetical protein